MGIDNNSYIMSFHWAKTRSYKLSYHIVVQEALGIGEISGVHFITGPQMS